MTKEKQERILLAGIAVSIVLLFIMLTVTVFQIVRINGKKREITALEQEMEDLEELKTQLLSDIDVWKTDAKIEEVARELGYKVRGDR